MKKILVAEDEKHIMRAVRDALEDEGFMVLAAVNGRDALDVALKEDIDLIILDIMMPGLNGFDVCRALRKEKEEVPVIMLTSKDTEKDKVKGLETGADDYMTKPFSIKELIARVKIRFRRMEIYKKAVNKKVNVFSFGDMKIDFIKMESFKKGKKIKFTKKEYDILRYFIERKGEVITRMDLLNVVWDLKNSPLTRTVDTFISRIRKKIEKDPSNPEYLKSIRDAGYKFDI